MKAQNSAAMTEIKGEKFCSSVVKIRREIVVSVFCCSDA